MITKERTEIAQTVKTASTARRPMYASMPGRDHRREAAATRAPLPPIISPLLLPVEGDRPRDGRGLAVGAVVLAGGNVPHVRLDHAHAHGGGAHADHADVVDLVGGDLPHLLAELDALLLRHPEGPLELLHQLPHARGRLLALGAC